MMKILRLFLAATFLFCAVPRASAADLWYAAEPVLRVGIWTGQTSLSVSSVSPFAVYDRATGKEIAKYAANAKVMAVMKNDVILLNQKSVKANAIVFRRTDADEKNGLELNRKKYRGEIEIFSRKGAGMTAVNCVPIEQYLYSVMPGEMPTSWPNEAIKAQAVAARSFALSSLDKHAGEDFQICASTHCQVYGGMTVEDERGTKAVDDTAGLVALNNGKAINAVFHSSSGGYTENSEEVWGTYVPYLRAVVDYDEGMPQYRWSKKMTAKEIETKLGEQRYAIGKLQAIEISPLKRGEENRAADRSKQGRVKTIRFVGDKGNIALTGAQARSLFGLNSTLFDIQIVVPVDKKIDVSVGYNYNKNIEVDLPPYKEKGWLTDKENTRRMQGATGELVQFDGFGWGHGLGLSQWGAKAMAMRAPKGQDTYFKEILKHYYQGIVIKKAY